MIKKILVIDDDVDLCVLLKRFLAKHGFEAQVAHSGHKGITMFNSDERFDAVICDYRLGDMDAIKVITAIKKSDADVPILVITGYSDIKTAVEVIKMGAFDYITKPLVPEEILCLLNKLIKESTSKISTGEKTSINAKGAKKTTQDSKKIYKGKADSTMHLYQQVNIVAGTNYSVILYGESGTGKEVIAHAIHELSPRCNKPFIALDCGTISKELAGSELFGHVKGAFTGALQDKEGHFEMAEGGTLFLDEVGNLSMEVQATLLRVIQERKFKQVGGNKEMSTDVRIIVASNENLNEAYKKGKFREDLYHRLNEFSIHLPPLRERNEDIIPLAEFFLEKSCEETEKQIKGFNEDVLHIFLTYPWPGNLREFMNVVRRAVLLTAAGKNIAIPSLPSEITQYAQNISPLIIKKNTETTEPEQKANKEATNEKMNKDLLKGAASRAEFDTIMAVLEKVKFNKKKAAELLNIDRKTLYNKIKNFQLLQ